MLQTHAEAHLHTPACGVLVGQGGAGFHCMMMGLVWDGGLGKCLLPSTPPYFCAFLHPCWLLPCSSPWGTSQRGGTPWCWQVGPTACIRVGQVQPGLRPSPTPLSPSLSLFLCLPPHYTEMISILPSPRARTLSAAPRPRWIISPALTGKVGTGSAPPRWELGRWSQCSPAPR